MFPKLGDTFVHNELIRKTGLFVFVPRSPFPSWLSDEDYFQWCLNDTDFPSWRFKFDPIRWAKYHAHVGD